MRVSKRVCEVESVCRGERVCGSERECVWSDRVRE